MAYSYKGAITFGLVYIPVTLSLSIKEQDIGFNISMPIKWKDLYNIKPNEVTIKNYKKYLNNSWDDFYLVQ